MALSFNSTHSNVNGDMITLTTHRRHLNSRKSPTPPASRGIYHLLDTSNNYKDKKHRRNSNNMNSSNLTILRIYSVVCTFLLILSLCYQLKILHDDKPLLGSSGSGSRMSVNSWDSQIIDMNSAVADDNVVTDDEKKGKCRIYLIP